MASHERASQQFSLHWDKCQENLLTSFEKLLNSEHFVDVSLAVESEVVKCHKVVLSACSAYFEKILIDNPCQHPVIIMRGMKYWEVLALVNFMYRGEVSVEEECLDPLLKAAEALQIRGLAVNEGTEQDPLHIGKSIGHMKSDNVIKPKKVYPRPKSKKLKPNSNVKMLNDEVEIKDWSGNNSNQQFTKDDKIDSSKNASSVDAVSGSLNQEEKTVTELEKNTVEPSTPPKNVMIKEEVHMEFVNADDVSMDDSTEYDHFQEDELSSDGNLLQMPTSEPGPSHHFMNMDSTSKERFAQQKKRKSGRKPQGPPDERLEGQHFLSKKVRGTRCIVCLKKGFRKETVYFCKTCVSNPTLHPDECFEVYHIQKTF